ncbi:hypothetical protein P261_01863 [Lachnospiraceae bacterium TWA4]|nr:hypothetical protein P261_01863 [Lachnospiraceae bacterium TWA4]
MAIYDVLIEDVNPCGGDRHAKKRFVEVETDDPVAYAKENSQWKLLDVSENPDGDIIVTTGDGKGYITRFIFSE